MPSKVSKTSGATEKPVKRRKRATPAKDTSKAGKAPQKATPALRKQSQMSSEERMKDDFRVFLFAIWMHLGLPKPTEIQYDIARYLQDGPRRSIIEAFRGVGKSWVTVAFVLWLLYCDPQLKIMVVSASKVKADDFSTFCLQLISEIDFLKHLYPKQEQRSSKIAFDVGPAKASKDPSVKSVGITGQITGSRADVIVPDDVEVPSNSLTQGKRDRLAELVKEFDAVLKPGGRIIYLGTPQTEQSLYLTLATRGYEVRIWPVRYPHEKLLKGIYAERLAPLVLDRLKADPSLVGQSTEPTRFTEEDLREREASYGRAGFSLQFMLDTSLSDAERYPLKLKDLMVMPLDRSKGPDSVAWGSSPETVINDLEQVGLNGDRWHRPIFVSKDYAKYTGSVMWIDPSGRGKDECAWAVVRSLFGYLYLTEVGASLNGYDDETLEEITKCAKRNEVNLILVESNFGDGMFTKLLNPWLVKSYPCTVEERRSTTQKEKRVIDILEPVMMQHRLVVSEEVVRKDQQTQYEDLPAEKQLKYRLFYQMTRVTSDRQSLAHDDRLEAVAGAVGYWVDQMAITNKQVVEDHRAEVLKDALDNFMNHALGRPSEDSRNGFEEIIGEADSDGFL